MGFNVSVVMAVKNESRYIFSAITSILDQSGLACELIVVDDHSDDGTFELVADRFQTWIDGNTLKLLRNPGRGKVAAFNYGVAQSKGQFVCLFAGDDLMPADSLAARYRAVEQAPSEQPVVGLCKVLTMSEDKRSDGILIPRAPGRGAFSGQCYLMNRAAVARLFPVPEDLPNEDTWLELALSYLPEIQLIHSGVVGCQWRVHDHNSMNYRVPFEEFNRRYTTRMKAIPTFLSMYATQMSESNLRVVTALARCELARASGSMIGVLTSGAPPVPTLRALAHTNQVMYELRRRLYALLSGW